MNVETNIRVSEAPVAVKKAPFLVRFIDGKAGWIAKQADAFERRVAGPGRFARAFRQSRDSRVGRILAKLFASDVETVKNCAPGDKTKCQVDVERSKTHERVSMAVAVAINVAPGVPGTVISAVASLCMLGASAANLVRGRFGTAKSLAGMAGQQLVLAIAMLPGCVGIPVWASVVSMLVLMQKARQLKALDAAATVGEVNDLAQYKQAQPDLATPSSGLAK